MKLSFIPPCVPDSHLQRVTNTRCRICTVFFPDDRAHSYLKHVEKSNKSTKKIFAPSCFYFQKTIQGCTANRTKVCHEYLNFPYLTREKKYLLVKTTRCHTVVPTQFHRFHPNNFARPVNFMKLYGFSKIRCQFVTGLEYIM